VVYRQSPAGLNWITGKLDEHGGKLLQIPVCLAHAEHTRLQRITGTYSPESMSIKWVRDCSSFVCTSYDDLSAFVPVLFSSLLVTIFFIVIKE
jgi:hypothetical protein